MSPLSLTLFLSFVLFLSLLPSLLPSPDETKQQLHQR